MERCDGDTTEDVGMAGLNAASRMSSVQEFVDFFVDLRRQRVAEAISMGEDTILGPNGEPIEDLVLSDASADRADGLERVVGAMDESPRYARAELTLLAEDEVLAIRQVATVALIETNVRISAITPNPPAGLSCLNQLDQT